MRCCHALVSVSPFSLRSNLRPSELDLLATSSSQWMLPSYTSQSMLCSHSGPFHRLPCKSVATGSGSVSAGRWFSPRPRPSPCRWMESPASWQLPASTSPCATKPTWCRRPSGATPCPCSMSRFLRSICRLLSKEGQLAGKGMGLIHDWQRHFSPFLGRVWEGIRSQK